MLAQRTPPSRTLSAIFLEKAHIPLEPSRAVVAVALQRFSRLMLPSSPLATSDMASEFRVEKTRIDATLTLSNGASVHGTFFVAGSSATHEGPEHVKDVLNAESGFFPFEIDDSRGGRTILYNRDHVLLVWLPANDEARLVPGYDVATRRTVMMLLSNGARLRGVVSVYRPQGRDRLSDFARSTETFRYLETPSGTYLVNVRHLIELVEEISKS